MIIPVRRHRHVDLSSPYIDAGRIRLQHRMRCFLPLIGTLAPSYLRFRSAGRSRRLTWLRHCDSPLLGQTAKPRTGNTLLIVNQSGVVSPTVTTAWCTELGTTLLIGFPNTTDIPAYFRRLNSSSVRQVTGSRQVPSRLVPRHAGALLLRNSPGLFEGDELETHGFGFCA
jgi:hypothetical protein